MSGRVVQGWQPDPFGLHEARYFSAAGQPTKLVRDRGAESYDEPPSGPEELAAARARMAPPPLPQPPAAYAPQGYVPVPAPRAAYPPGPAPRHEPRRRASGIVGFAASVIILAAMAAAAVLVTLTVLHPAKNAGAPRPDGSSGAFSSSTGSSSTGGTSP